MVLHGSVARRLGSPRVTHSVWSHRDEPRAHSLRARRLEMQSAQHEPWVVMRSDCFVCRSEGLSARSQILLHAGSREIVASLVHSSGELLGHGEIGLSDMAWEALGVIEGEEVTVAHAPSAVSLPDLRRRIYGNRLDASAYRGIVNDIVRRRYTDVHLSAFVTACSTLPMDRDEMVGLTRAMIDAGDRLIWPSRIVVDKHSVGGLPGNRTTPIVVAIMASEGLVMPKTSSRAITSPAGTADTMEVLTPVDLDLATIRRVVEQENGCFVWGGSVRLSPADDIIIGVERVLDVDAVGQLVASVLSKKLAAGSTHLVIDMPVGATAKVRTSDAAAELSAALEDVGAQFGLKLRVVTGAGDQPIGRGIGPALEARDVLAVLQNKNGPEDLVNRACELAGALLELAGRYPKGEGEPAARNAVASGRAWHKFQAICEAQGGLKSVPLARHRHDIAAQASGTLAAIDNRKLATLAKLAGAPQAKSAGVDVHVRLGDTIQSGLPLCTVHAESPGELDYALAFAAAEGAIFKVTP